jgi:DNA polymerase-3 subunit alpha (Gram-positive type)
MFHGIDGSTPPNIDLYIASEFEDEARNELNIITDHHGSEGGPSLVDLVVHDELSLMKRLHTLTGVDPRYIRMNDPKVLSLFRSIGGLGVTSDQIKTRVATYGIPEMGIRWVQEMLEITQPSSFSELVQISGLSHGNGTWEGNARGRIQAGEVSLTTSISSSRDQLMLDLMDYGLESDTAFAIANSVRKGKGISDVYCEVMLKCKVPDWYIESCHKIQYLFPKSFAVSFVIRAIRNAFYKLYYPLEFYASYFTVRGSNLDMELCAQGSETIIKSLEEKKDDAIERFPLELALEMTARGIRIKKSIHNSNYEFVIETDRGSLEVPLKQETYANN